MHEGTTGAGGKDGGLSGVFAFLKVSLEGAVQFCLGGGEFLVDGVGQCDGGLHRHSGTLAPEWQALVASYRGAERIKKRDKSVRGNRE